MPMVGSIVPARAAVVPRGTRVDGGETLPLEVHVRTLLRRFRRVAIVGPSGSGRTTALAHLAAALGDRDIDYYDEPTDLDPIETSLRRAVVALSDRARPPVDFGPVLTLAGWSESERIDYLLARHPSHVRAIMDRLHTCDCIADLEGSPRLWSLVLDAMATLGLAGDQVRGYLRGLCSSLLGGLREDERPAREAMRAVAQSGRPSDLPLRVPATLRHRFFCRCVLADALFDAAVDANRRFEGWSELRDPSVMKFVAERIQPVSVAHERLLDALRPSKPAHSIAASHPAIVSVLMRLDGGFRPPLGVRQLDRVQAPAARWSRMLLPDASLLEAVLHDADLSESDLSRADLRGADLARANLSRSSLEAAKLGEASLVEASLCDANLRDADLRGTQATLADFNHALLERVEFDGADLRGVSLRGATLTHALLTGALLEAADMTGAMLDHVGWHDADLRTVILADVRAHGASFVRCRFDGANYEGLRLTQCHFTGADFTGSVIRRSTFAKASFRQAGLADVDWEGVDLRDADFTNAAFHMGSSRSGLVDSPIACEGSRTGFYTDDYLEQDYRPPEAIRKANLCGANLIGAKVTGTDWYLVDLRGARYTTRQADWFRKCGAILVDRR